MIRKKERNGGVSDGEKDRQKNDRMYRWITKEKTREICSEGEKKN